MELVGKGRFRQPIKRNGAPIKRNGAEWQTKIIYFRFFNFCLFKCTFEVFNAMIKKSRNNKDDVSFAFLNCLITFY